MQYVYESELRAQLIPKYKIVVNFSMTAIPKMLHQDIQFNETKSIT